MEARTPEQESTIIKKLEDAVTTIITEVGEDPNREGLLKTPNRVAKAMLFLTEGYQKNLAGQL
jgi:GTP cyclohydrolase IA